MVDTSEKTSMLPTIKTEQMWLADDRHSGVYVLLEESMDNVIEQLTNMIREQLVGVDFCAISFASTLLAKSMTFAQEFVSHLKFEISGICS